MMTCLKTTRDFLHLQKRLRDLSPPSSLTQPLCQELDKALEKALGPQGTKQVLGKGEAEGPQPSTSSGQGGGDREPTPDPQESLRPKLNLASETWSLIPNKVRFMDEPDTYRANVGRQQEKSPRLMRAKTFPHLVFADPPASTDREDSPRQERAASHSPKGHLQGHTRQDNC